MNTRPRFNALVDLLEGEVEISIAGQPHRLLDGEMILLPAGLPHALQGVEVVQDDSHDDSIPSLKCKPDKDHLMKNTNLKVILSSLAVLAAAVLLSPLTAQAHCDGLDGSVVKAAQEALADGNVNLALSWVQKADEAEIIHAFKKTFAVRTLSAPARELADLYFFETLVRLHRAGEGAPFTGLKSAGRVGPAIPAGDKALETGNLDPVVKLLSKKMEHGLGEHFKEASAKRKFGPNDVEAGRDFVKAYVKYIHYVEGLHEAAASVARVTFPKPARLPNLLTSTSSNYSYRFHAN